MGLRELLWGQDGTSSGGSTCHWNHVSKSWSCAWGGRPLYDAAGANIFFPCLVSPLVNPDPWSIELTHGPGWTNHSAPSPWTQRLVQGWACDLRQANQRSSLGLLIVVQLELDGDKPSLSKDVPEAVAGQGFGEFYFAEHVG